MKNKSFKLFLVLLSAFILMEIYLNSSLHLAQKQWKYSKGLHLGDWLKPNELPNRYFCIGNQLLVFSDESFSDYGVYIAQ